MFHSVERKKINHKSFQNFNTLERNKTKLIFKDIVKKFIWG